MADTQNERANEKAPLPLVLHTRYTVEILRTKENKKQNEEQTPLQVAAAVGRTNSIARFSLLGSLVPCYPVYRLRPAFVNYAPPPEGARHPIRNKHSRLVVHPRHTALLL